MLRGSILATVGLVGSSTLRNELVPLDVVRTRPLGPVFCLGMGLAFGLLERRCLSVNLLLRTSISLLSRVVSFQGGLPPPPFPPLELASIIMPVSSGSSSTMTGSSPPSLSSVAVCSGSDSCPSVRHRVASCLSSGALSMRAVSPSGQDMT